MTPVPLVEVTRGAVVESLHHGIAVLAEASGAVLARWGDDGRAVFPRSSLKWLQAIPLVATGAADRFGLDDRHLALACASHHGQAAHLDLVDRWLPTLDLDQEALACGPALPMDTAAMEAHLRGGGRAERRIHNCSGKHCGLLTQCRAESWSVDGYEALDHPAQIRFREVLSAFLDDDADALPVAVDGCGLPAYAMPMAEMARAVARFARPGPDLPAAAARRLHRAIAAHPELLSASGSHEALIMRETGGRVLTKIGAEGYIVAALPDQGLGIALKIEDGDKRAATVALAGLLAHLKLVNPDETVALTPVSRPPLTNSTGATTGEMRFTPPPD